MTDLTLRMATTADAAQLLAIYAPYVTETAVTFEYDVPSLAEFTGRIGHILEKYPYIVAVRDGQIVGYTYASPFKGRAAYDWAVETTIYIREDLRSGGIGKRLYLALENVLRQQHILNANACIAYPNPDSIGFHERLGYKTVGHFSQCGYKLGTWYDMIWMEKMLDTHPANPKAVIWLPQLKNVVIE